ncbi:hypothetical protein D3C73_1359530 [compost metagenome]
MLLLKRLDDSDWQRTGVNAKGEQVTLEASVEGFVKHVHTHLGQIARIKRTIAAGVSR